MTTSSVDCIKENCKVDFEKKPLSFKNKLICLFKAGILVFLAHEFLHYLPEIKNRFFSAFNSLHFAAINLFNILHPLLSEISKYFLLYAPYAGSTFILYKICACKKNKSVNFWDCTSLFFVFSVILGYYLYPNMDMKTENTIGLVLLGNSVFNIFLGLTSYDGSTDKIEICIFSITLSLFATCGVCLLFLGLTTFNPN